ncbi:MAG: LacI family DNA-binding transcriptional regulator [Planctomycetota bacterium]|jgi:DNA-binding LacI/PurR family transcriptional regulator
MIKTLSTHSKVRDWLLSIASNPESDVDSIPSERQICQIHGVSRDTVRRAISSLVEEGVLEPRQGMGTFINKNFMESHIKRKVTEGTIGIIIFDGQARYNLDPYPWIILQTLINSLSLKGMKAQLITLQSKGLLAAKEIAAQEVSGVVWISPGENSFEIIEYLKEENIPAISIGGTNHDNQFNFVDNDDVYGGFIGGEYLLKQGHNRILLAGVIPEREFSTLRYKGFKNALAKYGVEHSPELLMGEFDINQMYEEVRGKIRAGIDFSAVFSVDGIFLRSIYSALKDEGRQVPEDISLLSYDKSQPGECPGLNDITEVCQPLEELGKEAVKSLIKILEGRQLAQVKQIFRPKLFEGSSCKKIQWQEI